MPRRTLLLLLVMLLVGAADAPPVLAAWVWSPQTGWIGPTGAVKDTPQEQLAFALAFFERQEYDRARREFQKLLKAYKASSEAAEAQYHLGRCYEEDGDYYKAFLEYRKTIQTYPSTKRFEEVLEREYQIGNYFLSGKKRKIFGTAALLPARDKAIEVFQAIAEDGPFSRHGELSQYKLGLAYVALDDHEQAVRAFEQVIDRYPDSPLVDDARFQIAQASLKGTFKPDYDQSPTELAIRELEVFLKEYPQSELSTDASRRLQELKERRAEHEYLVAQFYEGRRRTASALLYYEGIVQRFAQTAWAPKAAERLAALKPPAQ
ncbi:MAG: outer membrane protein assembly factor BamD [Candidatus Omnitrophota bacterium]|nr:outer membrane protein assembly factor BamD [Candidatus Omnitrophota bacterium]